MIIAAGMFFKYRRGLILIILMEDIFGGGGVVASHAVIFRVLVLPNTSSLKTTAWEARGGGGWGLLSCDILMGNRNIILSE